MQPLEEMIDDTVPAAAWTMRRRRDVQRFLVADAYYINGYWLRGDWAYTCWSLTHPELAREYAVAEVDRYEAEGWTLIGEPVSLPGLILRDWIHQQHGMKNKRSKALDVTFDTMLKHGNVA